MMIALRSCCCWRRLFNGTSGRLSCGSGRVVVEKGLDGALWYWKCVVEGRALAARCMTVCVPFLALAYYMCPSRVCFSAAVVHVLCTVQPSLAHLHIARVALIADLQ